MAQLEAEELGDGASHTNLGLFRTRANECDVVDVSVLNVVDYSQHFSRLDSVG